MLRLQGSYEMMTCPECKGKGTVPAEGQVSSLKPNAHGHFTTPEKGFPVPCPRCKGKKIVPVWGQK